MKKFLLGLALAVSLMMAPSAWALFDHHNNNDNTTAEADATAVAGAAALQKQNAEGGSTNTDVDAGEDENVYRGSFSHSVPEGNEGPAIFTPWGGVGVSKPARIYQLMAYGDYIDANTPEHKWLMAQLQSEIGETCRWLGIGPKGWKFPFLLGMDCWPDLRVWEE